MGKQRPIEVDIELAVAEIQRLAAELGRAPSRAEYNAQRKGALVASGLLRRGVTYSDLLERAGFEVVLRGGVPAHVEQEIREAFQQGDHLPVARRHWPLFAIPTRVERKEIPQADGSVFVLTRYYASLR